MQCTTAGWPTASQLFPPPCPLPKSRRYSYRFRIACKQHPNSEIYFIKLYNSCSGEPMVLFFFLLCRYKTFKIKEYTEECIQGILMEKVKLLIVLNILPHCLKNLYSLTVHGGCRCRVLIFRRISFKNILVNSKLFFLTLRLFSHHWTGS